MNEIAEGNDGFSHHDKKTDYERRETVWHVANCTVEDCEQCNAAADHGLVETCDSCGKIQHTDWLGWTGNVDSEGRCFMYCPTCASKPLEPEKDLRNLVAVLKSYAIKPHYSCEDTYYQCPHYDGDDWNPPDYTQECTCGANKHNAKVEELYAEIETLFGIM